MLACNNINGGCLVLGMIYLEMTIQISTVSCMACTDSTLHYHEIVYGFV